MLQQANSHKLSRGSRQTVAVDCFLLERDQLLRQGLQAGDEGACGDRFAGFPRERIVELEHVGRLLLVIVLLGGRAGGAAHRVVSFA